MAQRPYRSQLDPVDPGMNVARVAGHRRAFLVATPTREVSRLKPAIDALRYARVIQGDEQAQRGKQPSVIRGHQVVRLLRLPDVVKSTGSRRARLPRVAGKIECNIVIRRRIAAGGAVRSQHKSGGGGG